MSRTITDCARKRRNRTPRILLLPLCLCLWWSGGCFTARRAAVHDNKIFIPHPVILPASVVVSLEAPPDISLEIAPLPPALAAPHGGPARPRIAPQPVAEPASAVNKTEPSIAPELSAGELATDKMESYRSLEVAEHNLARTQGKTLSAAQQDLASKVREFMEMAREAMKSNDWGRAMNLAKKAEVLSQGLAAGM